MATQKERRSAPRKPVAASGAPQGEKLYRLIQEAAYFKAKARGFAPGGEVQDWIEAEAEVRRRLQAPRS